MSSPYTGSSSSYDNGENGLVYALDELADKYDPYFWEVAYPSIVGWFTREDGHLYGWPSHSTPLELMADSSQVTGNTLFMVLAVICTKQ